MRIEAPHNRIVLSHIFEWYDGDFEAYVPAKNLRGSGSPVLIFIRQYMTEAKSREFDSLHNPSLEFIEYDWGINAVSLH